MAIAKAFNSASRPAIRGASANLAEARLTCPAKSLHGMLLLRPTTLALNTAATFLFTFVAASLFFVPAAIASLMLSTEFAGEQSDWTVVTSSIRPLQALNAALHLTFAFAAFPSSFVGMQVLFTFSASSFISGFRYIAQTALSVSVFFPASPIFTLKASIVERQAFREAVVVSFNMAVLHSSVMEALHFPNSEVKFFKRRAPGFVPLPLHSRLLELPPPRALSLTIKGAKLADLLALLFDCFTNLSSLFFWASKFRTMSFFFMYPTTVATHVLGRHLLFSVI